MAGTWHPAKAFLGLHFVLESETERVISTVTVGIVFSQISFHNAQSNWFDLGKSYVTPHENSHLTSPRLCIQAHSVGALSYKIFLEAQAKLAEWTSGLSLELIGYQTPSLLISFHYKWGFLRRVAKWRALYYSGQFHWGLLNCVWMEIQRKENPSNWTELNVAVFATCALAVAKGSNFVWVVWEYTPAFCVALSRCSSCDWPVPHARSPAD
jgi:hypothetical protein